MPSSKNIFSQLLKTGSKNKLWSRPLYQFSSVTQSCTTLCDLMDCSMPGLPVHHQLLELTQTHIHWVGDAFNNLILCHPLFLPSIFPSIQVFPNESILPIRWLKYWSFSFNINSSNDIQDWFFFRMEWLDLLAVQGTLKSHPQHYNSKASVLWCSAFFMVQLSHPYMTTGETIPGDCSHEIKRPLCNYF